MTTAPRLAPRTGSVVAPDIAAANAAYIATLALPPLTRGQAAQARAALLNETPAHQAAAA
jgi:hypothetical protein